MDLENKKRSYNKKPKHKSLDILNFSIQFERQMTALFERQLTYKLTDKESKQ